MTLNKANEWQATITGLLKYDKGVEIKYTWEEEEIAGYKLVNTETEGTLTTLTNASNVGELVIIKEISGMGADEKDSFRFRVTITDQNGSPISGTYSDVTFDKKGQATFKLKGGEEKVISGLPVGTHYFVEELDANKWEYDTIYEGEEGDISEEEGGFALFVNDRDHRYYSPTPSPEESITPTPGGPTPTPGYTDWDISMLVRKVWDDNNNAAHTRPGSVTVHLCRNGVDTGIRVVLEPSNNWSYVFPNLPRYDENGKAITYSVTEETVSGYTVSISGDMFKGYTITNSKGGRVPNTRDGFHPVGWAASTIISILIGLWSAWKLSKFHA